MAEVFGLAAAGIGVAPIALELAKTVKKLKDYCRDVESARKDIQDFVDEVDALNHVLQDLEGLEIADCPSSSQALQRCRQLCAKANSTLSDVVTEIHLALKLEGKRTQLAFPLKKDKMEHLTEKVANAQRSLTLACNVYLMWQNRIQAQAQRQQAEMMSSMFKALQTQQYDHNRNFEDLISGNSAIRSSLQSLKISSRSRPSGSLVRGDESRRQAKRRKAWTGIWSLLLSLTTKGWTNRFRSYRIVLDEYSDPAFVAVLNGDITSLQRLICAGEASIYDRTVNGESMLIHAAFWGRMDMIRWLHEMGAHLDKDVLESERMLLNYLNRAPILAARHSRGISVSDLSENAIFIRESFEFEASDQDLHDFGRHLDWGVYRLYALAKPANLWSCSEVFDATMQYMECMTYQYQDITSLLGSMLELIERSPWAVEIWRQRDSLGRSLLHLLAAVFSGLEDDRGPPIASQPRGVLTDYLKRAIRSGADLHDSGRDFKETPFITGLVGDEVNLLWGSWNDQSVQHWVCVLLAEGVEIEEYGRTESEKWLWRKQSQDSSKLYAYGFTYGPRPKDWKVFLEHPGDRYAGLFWDLVENPKRRVPGAWEDDSESMWEDEYFEGVESRKRWGKLLRQTEHLQKHGSTIEEAGD